MLLILGATGSVYAQSLPEWKQKLKEEPAMRLGTSLPSISFLPPRPVLPRPAGMPSTYSYRELAPFCKLDVRLEQTFRLPVKFRLGEVQYVDRLEKKGPATVPSFP